MSIYDFTMAVTEYVLFASCLFILMGSIYISCKLRFIQLRFFPDLIKLLRDSLLDKSTEEGHHTILPHKALFTAMSTTLGISTIVAPVIAIYLGGPGAILGFILTSFFGSAATYTEVDLSIRHRQKLESGAFMGGPMQYLKHLISPRAAKWYAVSCLLLMTVWSGAQANQLSAILDSPLLGDYRIPTMISGGLTAVLVLMILMGGIKRVASWSAKLVPMMFVVYICSSLWILLANYDRLGEVIYTMFASALSPYEMATGTLVGGIVSALRWGVFKGTQACEAGIGTQAIPHSMAETEDPVTQGMLAMISTYTSGLVAFISGCVALLTNTWQNPELPLGISMVAASFEIYFAQFGIAIVAFSTLLFAFGTILGNCYNGSQCFGYLSNNKAVKYYFLGAACMVFIGSISEVKTFWSLIDLVLAAMVIPHMLALILYARAQSAEILTVIHQSVRPTVAQ